MLEEISMIHLNFTDNFYNYRNKKSESKVIIYGAGNCGKENYRQLGKVDFFCDKNAENIKQVDNIKCLLPSDLEKIKEHLIILVCVVSRELFENICVELEKLDINAEIFFLYDNPAFSWFDRDLYKYHEKEKEHLKIHLIYKEDGWIFGKFANKMKEELIKLGQEVDISPVEDVSADINHHISRGGPNYFLDEGNVLRTIMVTHVDSREKKDKLLFQTTHGAVGICMSSDTYKNMVAGGIPQEKLCYVNPAQDGEIKPRKIVLGITNRCYKKIDLRKRDDALLVISRKLNCNIFKFKIMGSGWDETVNQMRDLGFEVEYYPEFDREIYKELMPSLDYWMFFGFDEGAMGYLDAVAAGVKTITTPQGFHLDVKGGLTYSCKTIQDFTDVLLKIQIEKEESCKAVATWTWENYAKKHLEIWQYLSKTKSLKELYKNQSEYVDGIFSLLISNNQVNN